MGGLAPDRLQPTAGASGVRADRPQLAKQIFGLKAGDMVTVRKLDKLGRGAGLLHSELPVAAD